MASAAYLVCGDDEFLVSEAARQVVDRLVPTEARDLGLEIIDGRCASADAAVAALRRCTESLATPGFLGGAKLTWLRDATFLGGNRKGESETVRTLLTALAATVRRGLPAEQPLLVSTTAISRASALFKALAAAGEVQDFGSGFKPHELEKLASQRLDACLQRANLRMDAAARAAFLARVGTETRLIASEIEKLRTYVGEAAHATPADVEAIVSVGREAVVWDLVDTFGLREVGPLIRHLRRMLAQGEQPIGLVVMLDNRVRDLLILREALDRGWLKAGGGNSSSPPVWTALPAEIDAWFSAGTNDLRKQHWFRLTRLVEQAARWRLVDLRRMRWRLVELREKLVSTGLPAAFLVESTLLRDIGPAQPRRTTAAPQRTQTSREAR